MIEGCGKKLVARIYCGNYIPYSMYSHTRLVLCSDCRAKYFKIMGNKFFKEEDLKDE